MVLFLQRTNVRLPIACNFVRGAPYLEGLRVSQIGGICRWSGDGAGEEGEEDEGEGFAGIHGWGVGVLDGFGWGLIGLDVCDVVGKLGVLMLMLILV